MNKNRLEKDLIEAMSEGEAKVFKNFTTLKWKKDDLQELMKSLPLSRRFLTVLKEGKDVTPSPTHFRTKNFTHNLQPDISFTDIQKAIKNGGTIQMRNVQNFKSEFRKLQHGFMETFKCYVNLNLYLTPQGKVGSELHFDPYDVIIIQLDGKKSWQYGTKKKLKDITLNQGDALFLPAGMLHKAKALSKDSLHMTIGVHHLTVSGLMQTLSRNLRHEFLIPEAGRFSSLQVRKKMKKVVSLIDTMSDRDLEEAMVNYWHENLASTYLDFDKETSLSLDSQDGTWIFKGLERELHPKRGKAKK